MSYVIFQTNFPYLIETAVIQGQCLFLPDIRNIKDAELDKHFFESHLLKKDESKSGCWTSSDESVIVEEKAGMLRLVFGPSYQPSFCQGLHTSIILGSVISEESLSVISVDKPLIPFYLKIEETQTRPMSAKIMSNIKVDKISQRPASVPSNQRMDLRRFLRTTSVSSRSSVEEGKRETARQLSGDSGIESYLYDLPPRITSYDESEAFILDQTDHRQFLIALHKKVAPVKEELTKMNVAQFQCKEEIILLSKSLKELVHDSILSYSSNGYLKSPRYQDLIKSSIENIILQLVQDPLWFCVKTSFSKEDKAIHRKLTNLWSNGFICLDDSYDQDFLLPFPAALVELSALDMRLDIFPTSFNFIFCSLQEHTPG